MTILTQPQYYAHKAETEALAVLLDNDETPDLDYRVAQRRIDFLQKQFEAHWKTLHKRKYQMTKQEQVARALTGWMNGKKQEPKPDWDALTESVRAAYLEQAADALAAIESP